MAEGKVAPSAKAAQETTKGRYIDPGEDCWMLPVTIEGYNLDLLVDTGANKTLIDANVFKRYLPDEWQSLSKGAPGMKAANDTSIYVYGELKIAFELGGTVYPLIVTIAELGNVDGILGMDFLRRRNATVHAGHGYIQLEGKTIPLVDRERRIFYSHKVRIQEDLVLPGKHEVTTTGYVDKCSETSTGSCGTIEPLPSFYQQTGLLLANAVVNSAADTVPVTLVNLLDKQVTVKRGTLMATISMENEIPATRATKCAMVHHVSVVENHNAQLPSHLHDMHEKASTSLTMSQSQQLARLLHEYADVFVGPDGKLGTTGLVKHSINTGDNPPIRQPLRRLPLSQRQIEDEQVDNMLEKGIIEPSTSPWASPVVLVKKKDGSTRFCIDYRKLNTATVKDAYPLPRIDDTLDALTGSQWFCTLDLVSGYWQVQMEEKDREKTAFATRKGLFQFTVMPFGLCNAPSTFERLMELALQGLQWQRCLIYLDDVIVFGPSFQSTLDNLRAVFKCLLDANLRLKPSKCSLFQKEVIFLGHKVSRDGISCDPDKIKAIEEWGVPANVRDVRSFLGIASYYRKFIQGFSTIASPITALTKKGAKFVWDDKCQQAFQILKEKLVSAPILVYPQQEGRFILDTDASNDGLGAVLSQLQEGREHVVAYASKTLSGSQKNYCTTYKELLAVRLFVEKFKHYLFGHPFTVRTDHASLTWLKNFDNPDTMVMRWIAFLDTFDIKWEHRAGKHHSNADGLSRKPRKRCRLPSCSDCREETAEKAKDETLADSFIDDELLGFQAMTVHADVSQVQEGIDDLSGVQVPSTGSKTTSSSTLKSWIYPISISPDSNGCQNGNAPSDSWYQKWTNKELKELQGSDKAVSQIIAWKNDGTTKPPFSHIAGLDVQVKALWSMWGELQLKDGILYRMQHKGRPIGDPLEQIVAPMKLRNEILQHLHNDRTAGHLGVTKTLQRIKLRFYWPGCKHDVTFWCKTCKQCVQKKSGNQRQGEMQHTEVGAPFEKVAMDIVGPLPKTQNGNVFILVISDYFTRWVEAFPIKDQTAYTVADVFVTEFICRYGVPLQIHTDQGPDFMSHLFREMCKLLQIDQTRTTPYHPQSDGLVERFNRTLQQMLVSFVDETRKDWDDHIPYVMMAYRSTLQESTGCSPNKLLFGRENAGPIDLLVGKPPGRQNDLACPAEYVEWLRSVMTDAFEFAREKMRGSVSHQRRYYDKRVRDCHIRVGNWVWYFYPPCGKQKLGKGWLGPYLVTAKLSDVTFRIQQHSTSKPKVVHVNSLCPYEVGDEPNSWLSHDENNKETQTEIDSATPFHVTDSNGPSEDGPFGSECISNPETIPTCVDNEKSLNDQDDKAPLKNVLKNEPVDSLDAIPERRSRRGRLIRRPRRFNSE